MARLSEQTGLMADAERQYQKGLELAPDDLGTLVAYARFQDRLGRLDDAVRLYQRAARAHPNVASVHNDLGLCHARNRQYPQAISALTKAVELEPQRKLYRNNLAAVLVEVGNHDAAFDHLVAAHGEAVACYNLGYLLQKKGQTELAIKLFAKAVEKDPSLVQARTWRDQLQATLADRQAQPYGTATAGSEPADPALAGPLPSSPARSGHPLRQARRDPPAANPVRQLPTLQQEEAEPAPLPPARATSSPVIPLPSERSAAPAPPSPPAHDRSLTR
jgi:tetratricopeptide (TPR) repeat protein